MELHTVEDLFCFLDFRLDLCFEPLDFVFFSVTKGYRRKERKVKNMEGNKDRNKNIEKEWTTEGRKKRKIEVHETHWQGERQRAKREGKKTEWYKLMNWKHWKSRATGRSEKRVTIKCGTVRDAEQMLYTLLRAKMTQDMSSTAKVLKAGWIKPEDTFVSIHPATVFIDTT